MPYEKITPTIIHHLLINLSHSENAGDALIQAALLAKFSDTGEGLKFRSYEHCGEDYRNTAYVDVSTDFMKDIDIIAKFILEIGPSPIELDDPDDDYGPRFTSVVFGVFNYRKFDQVST